MILISRCSWGRVSTTIGVGLHPSAIVVIDLGRWDCRGLRTVDVLSSHLPLLFCAVTRPCMGRAYVNPTAYSSAVQWDELVGWSRVIWFVGYGRLAVVVHGWVSPKIGLSSSSFNLWMCTSSAELETYSNGCVLSIGQDTVWTSYVDSEYCDLSFYLWLCPYWLDGCHHSLSYYHWFIYYHCYAIIWSWHIYLLLFL
jgi:hypothetical protein